MGLFIVANTVLFAQSLTIRNVTVIDANGVRPHQTVAITGRRITTVATSSSRAGIDGTGKYLIPALWDMHVHLWESDPMLNLYIAAGVLGVRDMGSHIDRTRRLRDDVAAGKILGPRIYTSGPALDGTASGNSKLPVLACPDPESARQSVDKVERSSADFVKILSGLSAEEYRSIAQRARVIRIPFAGHIPDSVTALEAVEARQLSVEQMFGIPMACTPLETSLREERDKARAKGDRAALGKIEERVYSTFSPRIANDLFHRMAQFNVWQTPTLTLWQRILLRDTERLKGTPEVRYVPEAVRKDWASAKSDDPPASPEKYEFFAKLANLIVHSGAGVLAGTDTGDPWVVPGFGLHDELKAMVAAGFTPLEALTTATLGPARYFQLEPSTGTIAKNKTADLVLLDADPIADIRNTRRIHAVIVNGRLLTRACLDALLAGKSGQCPAAAVSGSNPAPKPAATPARKRRRS